MAINSLLCEGITITALVSIFCVGGGGFLSEAKKLTTTNTKY